MSALATTIQHIMFEILEKKATCFHDLFNKISGLLKNKYPMNMQEILFIFIPPPPLLLRNPEPILNFDIFEPFYFL